MLESVLFRNIEIVSGESIKTGDVLVKDGKIAEVGWDLPRHAELIVEDSGLTLMPGVIDPHVHLREPGATHKEDLESGSKAAASGGVTSFFDMPNTTPLTITSAAVAHKKQLASQKSIVNY
ncbi:dihydroorotase, partial [bacterium]|nr:dihydroorotase [bacterium]